MKAGGAGARGQPVSLPDPLGQREGQKRQEEQKGRGWERGPAPTKVEDKALALGPWSCSHNAGADVRW